MTTMTCEVEWGFNNMFGSFCHVGSRYITDAVPAARQKARSMARILSREHKRVVRVYTIVGHAPINEEVWKGGYQQS